MGADVFISYSSKDKQTADAVCHYLEEKSISCWIAPRDIPYGHEWANDVVAAIAGCRVVVLVFSSYANESPIVQREVLAAVTREIIIVPFRIENVLPEKGMELFISASHWLDAITRPVEGHLNFLAENVERILSGDPEFVSKHDPVLEIEMIATRWVDSGCEYAMLEGINKQLHLLIQEPPEDFRIKDRNSLLMLMMAALHFGADWGFWVKENLGNEQAIRQLLMQLHIEYLRPRLRALYALQLFKKGDVKKVVAELGEDVSAGNTALIEKYVYTQTVGQYMEKLKNCGEIDIGLKAASVVKEIGRYCESAGDTGNDSDLPFL